MVAQRGVPGGTSNVVFGHVGAPGPPWGPKWLPDLAPRPSRPLRTLIFKDFGSIVGGFLEDFGRLFVTMSCRTVTRVPRFFGAPPCCDPPPQPTTHSPQPTSGHGGGDGPQGSCIFPESVSEGFLLCRSSAGAELSFPGRCRRGAAASFP